MELNKIYEEDCLATLSRMQDNSIDLVVTSPPYNKGAYADGAQCKNWTQLDGGKIAYDTYDDSMKPDEYESWQKKLISECIRVLKPSGSLFYNHKDIISDGLIVHPKWVYGFPVREVIIWDRGSGPQISNRYFMPANEYIWWIVKDPKQVYFDKDKSAYRTNIWRVNVEKNPHPAPFPQKLVNSIIASCSPTSGVVYDPFMGSGTTALCTINVGGGRSYIGSEISHTYVKMAEDRIKIEQSQLTLF